MSVGTDILVVPDRFEALSGAEQATLQSVIVPVDESLDEVDDRFSEIYSTGRGSLMVLKGVSGAGKSTFSKTVRLFREDVVIDTIPGASDLATELKSKPAISANRILVIEGREALAQLQRASIEAMLHAINTFLRSPEGKTTLAVWLVNTDEMSDLLIEISSGIGGEALIGVDEAAHVFTGPPREYFVSIAEKTIGALNAGATLSTLGITTDRAQSIADEASTIGNYLRRIGKELNRNVRNVKKLLPKEPLQVWVVVVAPNSDDAVAPLTRGQFSLVDIDRMMTSTGANVVSDLQQFPEQVGLLSTVLDARVVPFDPWSAQAAVRTFASERLRGIMITEGLSVRKDRKVNERISKSTLAKLLSDLPLGTGRRGKKAGDNTVKAFNALTKIATNDDTEVNRCVGQALLSAGIISDFDVEAAFGNAQLKYRSDLLVTKTDGTKVRIELMWRKSASPADVSNYVLRKLEIYGKSVGLLTP